MQKFYFLFLVFALSVFTVSADESEKEAKFKSSFDLDYLVYEDEGAVSAALVLGGVVISGDYVASTKKIEGVDSKSSWHVGLGLNKRVHIIRNKLFIEGRLGASYRYVGIKYADGYTDEMLGLADSGFGYYAYPRIDIALFSRTCLTAGYKFEFADFKLSKDYMTTCITAGLSFLF